MAKKNKPEGSIYVELHDIKRLLMLKLLSDGITQSQIAAALGMDPGNLSRMLPAKTLLKGKKKS